MYPLEETSSGQACYYFSQVDLWICVNRSGQKNSLHSISLHLVQAYVMRWCRYKTVNGPFKLCQWYIKDYRVHLCHLPGLGQVGHSPKGSQWQCWGPGLGPSVVRPQVLPPPTMWPTWSLTGWLLCTWLTAWLLNEMSTWPSSQAETSCGQVWYYFTFWVRLTLGQMHSPRQRHLVAKCNTTAPLGQVDLWLDVPPTGRDILWLSVILCQVELCIRGHIWCQEWQFQLH